MTDLDLFERMTRRYPEDRITMLEIRKHPWVNCKVEPPESFFNIMSEKVNVVSQVIKQQALKTLDKYSCLKGEFSSHSTAKNEAAQVPDHLKKLMLEYKSKTKKTRKDCLSLVHTSSKSSSKEESAGGDCEEQPPVRKKKDQSGEMTNAFPSRFKRSDEDSWSSLSDNEDQSNY